MTDITSVNDVAVAWVQALQARGVTVRAHGKKGLALVPKSAYGEMSNEERATLKAHKRDIVQIVREGKYATAAVEPQAAKAPPAPCPHCYRAPCIGESHELFSSLHPDAQEKPRYSLAEFARLATLTDPFSRGRSSREDPTAVMQKQWGKVPDWYRD